jgi:hypothetical protein
VVQGQGETQFLIQEFGTYCKSDYMSTRPPVTLRVHIALYVSSAVLCPYPVSRCNEFVS